MKAYQLTYLYFLFYILLCRAVKAMGKICDVGKVGGWMRIRYKNVKNEKGRRKRKKKMNTSRLVYFCEREDYETA